MSRRNMYFLFSWITGQRYIDKKTFFQPIFLTKSKPKLHSPHLFFGIGEGTHGSSFRFFFFLQAGTRGIFPLEGKT